MDEGCPVEVVRGNGLETLLVGGGFGGDGGQSYGGGGGSYGGDGNGVFGFWDSNH